MFHICWVMIIKDEKDKSLTEMEALGDIFLLSGFMLEQTDGPDSFLNFSMSSNSQDLEVWLNKGFTIRN